MSIYTGSTRDTFTILNKEHFTILNKEHFTILNKEHFQILNKEHFTFIFKKSIKNASLKNYHFIFFCCRLADYINGLKMKKMFRIMGKD